MMSCECSAFGCEHRRSALLFPFTQTGQFAQTGAVLLCLSWANTPCIGHHKLTCRTTSAGFCVCGLVAVRSSAQMRGSVAGRGSMGAVGGLKNGA
eukprot:2512319-Rhodomonas_salina.2